MDAGAGVNGRGRLDGGAAGAGAWWGLVVGVGRGGSVGMGAVCGARGHGAVPADDGDAQSSPGPIR